VFSIGAVSLVGSVVLYLLGGLDVWEWAFVFAGIFSLLQSAVIIQSLRADHGELTPGANSNASGVGVLLALAEQLRGTPLQNTEVWMTCCGSHTSGGNGLRELLRRHSADLSTAWFIGFEGVGVGDRLIVINREGWLRRSVHPAVRDLIARAAAAHPDREIETRATSRNTVVAAALWRGCKSVCVNVYDKRNDIPYAYNLDDTVEQLQLSALDAAHEFGWQLLQLIDRG
jgi:Zn-dependent M28 family amino/carboxypeptidase